jgi:energy-coupling factor transport system ATP-binding protein
MQIDVQNLTYEYRSPFSPARTALRDVSFKIESRLITAIVGATGSGKTTLVQHLNGLLQPTAGKILIDSRDLSASKAHLAWARKKVGLVFQFPEFQLFEENVFDDVAFGPRNLGLTAEEVEECVRQSLALVGLDFERFGSVSPLRLSGGEKRRVAIAGVLAMNPQVLVMDEPTVGLDRRSAQMVEDVMCSYHRQGRSVVFVTHDMDLVARLAEHVLVLSRGRLLFQGFKSDLFRDDVVVNQAGLILPHVCQFMQEVKKRGYPVRTDVFNIKEAKQELGRVIKAKRSSNDAEIL